MGRGTRRKHPMFALEPAAADAPRVGVEWLDRAHAMAHSGPHGHQFLSLVFFERGGGRQRVGSQEWDVSAGDLFLIAPGETHDASGLGAAAGWMVEFSADAIEPGGDTVPFLSWRGNPLLSPFVRSSGGNVVRFEVPAEDRPEWSRRLRLMDRELRERNAGFREVPVEGLSAGNSGSDLTADEAAKKGVELSAQAPPEGLFEPSGKVLVEHKGEELMVPEKGLEAHLGHGDEILDPTGRAAQEERD